ncbi:hypothetical protein BOTBODRAFT_27021 [Botryobasidium botryosum FD-172 SS1]|uniref:Uncharacterized protein n=1 Tax=Botryobasidium botryosum (strain FD-172 SS1) TaxID=930990 RepID=A0A067NB48_BOTB1|nr:hypothetical protein BOTBODRAFT_27021 [Botryobasidium botryosum FD-172 SS1]
MESKEVDTHDARAATTPLVVCRPIKPLQQRRPSFLSLPFVFLCSGAPIFGWEIVSPGFEKSNGGYEHN